MSWGGGLCRCGFLSITTPSRMFCCCCKEEEEEEEEDCHWTGDDATRDSLGEMGLSSLGASCLSGIQGSSWFLCIIGRFQAEMD